MYVINVILDVWVISLFIIYDGCFRVLGLGCKRINKKLKILVVIGIGMGGEFFLVCFFIIFEIWIKKEIVMRYFKWNLFLKKGRK